MVGFGDGIPFAPHLYFPQFLDEEFERWKGLYWGKQIMKECKEIWIFCDELTEGMIEEIEEAKKLGLEMKFFNRKKEEINNANYLIHREIGPAYRRVIAEYYGDRFYFEGCGDCNKRGSDDGSDKEDVVEEKPEEQPERNSFWSRFFGVKG